MSNSLNSSTIFACFSTSHTAIVMPDDAPVHASPILLCPRSQPGAVVRSIRSIGGYDRGDLMIRSAIAVWRGSPAIGEGAVTTTSGVMSNALYSFGSATGNEPCTSPSEMLAASVASCVSLMVAQELAKAHLKYESVQTEAVLALQEKMGHWEISGI